MGNVTFKGVTKSFGKVTALQDLNLAIMEGEFVSLLGPSGSGKTTTLNLLAGLLPMDEGEIAIDGRVVNDLSPDKRDIAMVFQNYALYPHMTVFENLAFPLRARGRRQAEAQIRKQIETVAAMLGVGDLLSRYPRELSGGQQQRVALGRAMVRDPKVFLLDEPLSNLDARLRIRMRQDIKALHARIGSTIVYVTHDQAEAMTLSTRIAVFSKGKLQQFAPPAEIYNNPANLFVAGFVGEREINLFDGKVEPVSGGLSLDIGGVHLPLGPQEGLTNLAGRRLKVGIRPEGLEPETIGGPGRLAGTIALTELIGPDQILKVKVGDISLDCRADPRLGFAVGDLVHLRPRQEEIHLFDPDTQVNVRAQAAPLAKAS
jgi:multiple sugar transport system ATP-binding protein